MILLGIDFGEKNMGLAIATGPLAEPLQNLRVTPKLFEQIYQICKRLGVDLTVVGISEGKMAQKTKKFASNLQKVVNIPVVFQDETLSTQLVVQKLKEASTKRKKQRGPKHSFSATLILQDYLDRKAKDFTK